MKYTEEEIQDMAEKVRSEGIPDDENIYLGFNVPRKKAKNAQRIFDGRVIWECYECGAIIDAQEEKLDDFLQSCESCHTVNHVMVSEVSKEISKVRTPKKLPWERTMVTENTEVEKEDVVPEDQTPNGVPQSWKEFSALKKRVDRLENLWIIKLFLR